jgi:hypothetical protein
MRTPLGAALILLSGCASLGRAWTVPPPAPTVADLEQRCEYRDILDEKGARIPFMLQVACPQLVGLTDEDYRGVTARKAASIGVLLEREMVSVARPPQPRGQWTVNAYLSTGPGDSFFDYVSKQPGFAHFPATAVFAPDTMAALRGRAARLREERAYNQCRHMMVDIEASAAAPEKSQACARLVEAVDRDRSLLESQAARYEMAALERSRLQLEQNRASAEDFRRLGDSIREIAASRPPIQIAPIGRRSVTTNCHTYGTVTNCTTD